MSRYSHRHDSSTLLAAAQQWKDQCLLEDSSLLSDKALWARETLDELDRVFTQNPMEGGESYIDKLSQQLGQASAEASQLMAELNWALLLFSSNIKPGTKRDLVQRVWELSGSPLPNLMELMDDDHLSGIGSTGTGFNTHRWRELGFLITVIQALKREDSARREQLLNDPWVFSDWLESIKGAANRQLRHILPYLLFPDTFEHISVGRDKEKILEAMGGMTRAQMRRMTVKEIDQSLLELRGKLENQHNGQVDFYQSPWVDQWRPAKGAWLMAWNPKNWPWESFQNDRYRIANNENVIRRWSTSSSQPQEGDTAYLVRLGSEPRGLIACGTIASKVYEDRHYDPERAANGETIRVVDITLTDLRDPEVDAYIHMQQLENDTPDDQQWAPQSSGIAIKSQAARKVAELWKKLPLVHAAETTPETPEQEAVQIARPTNRIYYGPPGTGKTHHLETQLMPLYESTAKQVSTEEWLEEQLSDTSWWEATALALADLGDKATINALLDHPYFRAKARVQGRPNGRNLRAQCWAALQSHTGPNSETVNYAHSRRQPPWIFDKQSDGQWILTGDWDEAGQELRVLLDRLQKGPASDSERIRRHLTVTFHQSYAYEDFVEGIRPQSTDDGSVSYEVRDGLFKKLCLHARQDPRQRYALFIDEINRGNIARIFGELITLIEADKRAWWSDDGQRVEGVEVKLPYSGDDFGVPKNLDIYATMNTADRSTALMDAALRRRFQFHELMPNPSLIAGTHEGGYITDGEEGHINLRALLDAMNQRLRYLLHRDQTFGHAYFTEVKTFKGLCQVMVYDIIPMLAEYFYNDWRQIRLILADEGADTEQQLITKSRLDPGKLFPDGALEMVEKPDYQVKPAEEITPDGIRKIYESMESES